MSEIILDNVSKSFGDTIAIKDLSLTIADGEFIVLLGPTGAGKTTSLRLVAGLEYSDQGKVFNNGRDVTTLDPSQRDVTFVFQQYSLYPHYSVYENMAFPLRAPGRNMDNAAIDARVREIANLLRIEHKLENKATQLSGGEMQRVSIGRALVRVPSIFLMDEPLSSLDAKLRDDLRVELKRIQRDLGATVLYVTHDQLEAMTLADRIGILDRGRMVQLDSPRVVYEKPANTYAAKRLGSPQINLLPAGTLNLSSESKNTHTIGLRPEDVVIRKSNGVPAKVLMVEHLGVESIVLLETGEHQIRALLDRRARIEKGNKVMISGLQQNICEFDAQGNAI